MYAIRQKSTGHWLPRFAGHAGGTRVEPSKTALPRLFARKRDAMSALSWWLDGRVCAYATSGLDDYDYDLRTAPVAHREAEDMEIVQVDLVVR